MATLLLAALAGVLASLSPCVLPILPLVLAGAAARHRAGPAALALGLAVSFAGVGVVLGLAGQALGFDPELLRLAAALVMLLAGAALLAAGLATRFATAAEGLLAPVANYAQRMSAEGLSGQFTLGLVLGLAWAPCTGPVLGGAVALAAQAATAPRAAATMLSFALGAALPLLALGYAARGAVPRLRRGLAGAGNWARPAMGGALVLFGVLVLSGLDKWVEAAATAALPESWLDLVTRF